MNSFRFLIKPIFISLLFLFCCILILLDGSAVGWTWDEVYYFLSSQRQIAWFEALCSASSLTEIQHVLSRDFVDTHWLWNTYYNPHPPFYKILSSITWFAFNPVLGDFVSYRLSSALIAATLIVFLYMAIEKKHGFLPAFCGCLTLLLMPRFFGHAHIAATEIPLAAFWFMTCYFFYNGLTRRWSAAAAGIFLGFACAVKFTAFLIPIPLMLWALLYKEKKALRPIFCMLMTASLIAIAVNPGWWHSPFDKLYDFFVQSLSRKDTTLISTYFMGIRYEFSPSLMYGPCMLCITLPAGALISMIAGALYIAKTRFRDSQDVFYLINIPVILAVVALPGTPVHDGIRQFFPTLPFLAYLSACGYSGLLRSSATFNVSDGVKKVMVGACFFSLLLSQGWQVKKYHPYYLSYYNEIIGGLYGAYNRGMEITYWFDAFDRTCIDYINMYIPIPAKIGVYPPNIEYFEFLQSMGKIKKGIVFIAPEKLSVNIPGKRAEQEEYFILLSRLAGFRESHWFILKNVTPHYSVRVDGVQLLGIYKSDNAPGA